MTEDAIKALQGNENGFYLEVEAGRVDHANHDGNLFRALTDGVAFAEAVAKADELTDDADTLIIVHRRPRACHRLQRLFAGVARRSTACATASIRPG